MDEAKTLTLLSAEELAYELSICRNLTSPWCTANFARIEAHIAALAAENERLRDQKDALLRERADIIDAMADQFEPEDIGCLYDCVAYISCELKYLEGLRTSGRREGLERAAKACDQKEQDYLSPQYATAQPLSSFSERAACKSCAAAIRALAEGET